MRIATTVAGLLAVAVAVAAVDCPPTAQTEDEPPLVAGYVDEHNGGCDTDPLGGDQHFQAITGAEFCGTAGWYEVGDDLRRDTDWFTLALTGSGGGVRIRGIADRSTYVFVRAAQCDAPTVLESVGLVSHEWRGMTFYWSEGTAVWLFVAAPLLDEPEAPASWNYRLEFDTVTPVEARSWSTVKALFP